jgi:hypothetical protein
VHSAALVLSTAPPTSKRAARGGSTAAQVTEYAALGPEAGTIVMFPGRLYHGGGLYKLHSRDPQLESAWKVPGFNQ